MSLQLEKRGFYQKLYVQDTKNPGFPAQFFILLPTGTVRGLLRQVPRIRPGQDLPGRSLGRYGQGPWAEGGKKRPQVHFLPKGQDRTDVPQALCGLFGQETFRGPQRQPGLAVLLRYLHRDRPPAQLQDSERNPLGTGGKARHDVKPSLKIGQFKIRIY